MINPNSLIRWISVIRWSWLYARVSRWNMLLTIHPSPFKILDCSNVVFVYVIIWNTVLDCTLHVNICPFLFILKGQNKLISTVSDRCCFKTATICLQPAVRSSSWYKLNFIFSKLRFLKLHLQLVRYWLFITFPQNPASKGLNNWFNVLEDLLLLDHLLA